MATIKCAYKTQSTELWRIANAIAETEGHSAYVNHGTIRVMCPIAPTADMLNQMKKITTVIADVVKSAASSDTNSNGFSSEADSLDDAQHPVICTIKTIANDPLTKAIVQLISTNLDLKVIRADRTSGLLRATSAILPRLPLIVNSSYIIERVMRNGGAAGGGASSFSGPPGGENA